MLSTPPPATVTVSFPAELLSVGCQRVAIALGVFDGVHLGHQAILQQLTSLSLQTDAQPVALFFDPHPRQVLRPKTPLPLLTQVKQRQSLLLQHGAAFLIRFPFTLELAAMSPESFLERHFAIPSLTITGFCVGENWRFGHLNIGDLDTLRSWSTPRGIITSPVAPICLDGQLISSTRIRQSLRDGDLSGAASMLGRPYSILGQVVRGRGLGGSILHCPTANLSADNTALPPFGVYAAMSREGDRRLPGIAYIGDAPTIRNDGQQEITVELHLFDCDDNLYDREILIEFHRFLRPSRKFDSPEELKKQIQQDIKEARACLA